MQVTLDKIYPIPGSADVAWQFLQDIEGVAQCMPGARITERLDDTRYKGTVSVRLGPASMSFKGEITVISIDADTQTLHLAGKGTDTSGASGASLDLIATVRAAGEHSELVGKSTITMNGKAAAFGGRMMDSVSEQILKQFVANFSKQVQALQAQQGGETSADPDGNVRLDSPAAAASAPADPPALNGLALLRAVIADWFRRLFTRRPV